jgi:hypothetical protein
MNPEPLRIVHGSQALDERPFWEVHSLDPGHRAFRRLELYPNGQIVTEVIWDHAGPPWGAVTKPEPNNALQLTASSLRCGAGPAGLQGSDPRRPHAEAVRQVKQAHTLEV